LGGILALEIILLLCQLENRRDDGLDMLQGIAAEFLLCQRIKPALNVECADILHPSASAQRLQMILPDVTIAFGCARPLVFFDPRQIYTLDEIAKSCYALRWNLGSVDGAHVLLGRILDISGRT